MNDIDKWIWRQCMEKVDEYLGVFKGAKTANRLQQIENDPYLSIPTIDMKIDMKNDKLLFSWRGIVEEKND